MAQGELLLLLGAHLVLTGLPGVAATLFAARRGVTSVPVLLAIGLAVTGLVAILAFWAYYASHLVGETYVYLVLLGSVLLVVWSLHGRRIDSALLRQLATPLVLWALGSAFLVFLGFVHGGSDFPPSTAATRFSHMLPSDNDLPRYFGEWFYLHGHDGPPPPFPPGWLSSERPPLQAGFALSQWVFGLDSRGSSYHVLAVTLQQLWIVGLWALLLAARVGRVTRALAVVTVLVSDVAIVNGFFAWPKMLPVAMLLAAAALVLTPLWPRLRQSLWGAVLLAALFALALLSHGSSAFGVIPLAVIAALRGVPSWRWIGVGVLSGLVLMVPWSAYQSYGDPPGNRLAKWTLAGDPTFDERGTLEAAVDAYGEAGVGGTLDNKVDNFVAMTGGAPALEIAENVVRAAGSGEFEEALREVRMARFYYLLPALGLLLIAPAAMILARDRGRRNPHEWHLALGCFAVLGLGALVWGLLLFGNPASKPALHIGSYLLPVLGLCGAVMGLRATFPRFATYWVSANALMMLAIYVPSLDPPPDSSYSALAALLAAVSLAGFCVVAFRSGEAPRATNTLNR